MAAEETTAAALQRYSAFVEEILRPQLTQTLAKRDALTTEMNEYQELLELVRELLGQRLKSGTEAASAKPEPLHVLMDLGHKFRVRAKVSDPSLITVDVGLNFHVEMTLEEAQAFASGHLVHLTRCVERFAYQE